MKTSSYKRYTGSEGVSISIYPPNGFSGIQFLSLAPDKDTFYAKKNNEIDEEEFERRYRKNTLSKLNAEDIYKRFRNSVLLCWEPPGTFCHRRIIASWIQEEIGIEVPEWNPEDEKKISNNRPLF